MSNQQVVSNGFDLSSVLAQANKVKADSENGGGGGSNEKLIYPQVGTLKVRLLFNPKSQVVIRKFERHTINTNKVACLKQYGEECPICKIISDIENAKGLDFWKYKRTIRGIGYAEYISDTYHWDNPNDKPQPGELILLMFPWTIYQDLNRIMSNAGPNLGSVVASNVGSVIVIERFVQNGQTKYSASIDAFDMNHQTRPSDQEYNDLLMSLDDLNDKYVPQTLTDSLVSKAREVAEQLSKEYLNPVNTGIQEGPQSQNIGAMGNIPLAPNPAYYKDPVSGQEYDLINNQWVPRVPPTPPTPPTPSTPMNPPVQNQTSQNLGGFMQSPSENNTNAGFMQPPVNSQQSAQPQQNTQVQQNQQSISGNPACFGQHGSVNPNQCLVCFKEAECSANSR